MKNAEAALKKQVNWTGSVNSLSSQIEWSMSFMYYILQRHDNKFLNFVCKTFGRCSSFEQELYTDEICEEVHGTQTIGYGESRKSHEKAIASVKASIDEQNEEDSYVQQQEIH